MSAIVLFDMDGTLTEPRKPAEREMSYALYGLAKIANIGIVTGSGIEYVLEQCSIFWDKPECFIGEKITIMPCNGTMVYKWYDNKWNLTFSKSIRDYLGQKDFQKLMKLLIWFQGDSLDKWGDRFPLTGHHISHRSSLINFCPIGRNATHEDREKFVEFDKKRKYREIQLESLKKVLRVNGLSNLSVTLGGSTSFDIYPIGWDKTFSLRHHTGFRQWFVGDRCEKDGNDRTIYEELSKENRAFKTSSPEETIKIIENIMRLIKEKY